MTQNCLHLATAVIEDRTGTLPMPSIAQLRISEARCHRLNEPYSVHRHPAMPVLFDHQNSRDQWNYPWKRPVGIDWSLGDKDSKRCWRSTGRDLPESREPMISTESRRLSLEMGIAGMWNERYTAEDVVDSDFLVVVRDCCYRLTWYIVFYWYLATGNIFSPSNWLGLFSLCLSSLPTERLITFPWLFFSSLLAVLV